MEAALSPRSTAVRPVTKPVAPAYERPSRPTTGRSKEVALHLVPTRDGARSRETDATLDALEERSERLIRAANVVVAFVGLVLLAPVMVVLAVLVRLTSAGPAFYSQTRVGVDRRWRQNRRDDRRVQDHGGKPFEMYKFRSMRVDAEAD